ncbi:helix-turn-helix transcriptional regulator [Nostoc sp.]|uniref:helix-turn-helix transcriptional regulator n=1 Tax=Nostoc sp. TaxID=1180 RepID=UPI002FFC66E2
MKHRSKQRKQESDSPLETLRLERTHLNQDELAMRCGIPRATYQRWISGRTEARLTVMQFKKLCKELSIDKIEDLPDEFGPPDRIENTEV